MHWPSGYSGIAPATLERIIWHIDNDIIPVVPEKGSVGASGDLAPLAHLFLPLIGHGEVEQNGKIMPASACTGRAWARAGGIGSKRGPGVDQRHTVYSLICRKGGERLHQVLETADLVGAMSLEGLMGSARPFDPRLHNIRPLQRQ